MLGSGSSICESAPKRGSPRFSVQPGSGDYQQVVETAWIFASLAAAALQGAIGAMDLEMPLLLQPLALGSSWSPAPETVESPNGTLPKCVRGAKPRAGTAFFAWHEASRYDPTTL